MAITTFRLAICRTDQYQGEEFVLGLLEQLYQLRSRRPSLFRRSVYSIDRKTSKDAVRYSKMLTNCLPPPEAIQYVQVHRAKWESCPEDFWRVQSCILLFGSGISPQAKIAGSYVAAMRSDI